MPRTSKCLIIDVNITCAASEKDSLDALAKSCRDLLKTMRETTNHKVVLTDTIRAEQRKHPSKFAEAWLRSMFAKKRVCWLDVPADIELRNKVEQLATSQNKLIAMQEDIHLIEAALKADKTILSMDEEVRVCFQNAARKVVALRLIGWINPCKSDHTLDDTIVLWLQNGAELERERLLGYSREDSTD